MPGIEGADQPTRLIDAFLPAPQFSEQHAAMIDAPPSRVYPHVRNLDLQHDRGVAALFRARGLPPQALTVGGLMDAGFLLLGERAGQELLFGLVGRFWTLSGGLLRLDPQRFAGFEEPGYAKAAWDFRLAPIGEGRTRLSTETRVRCTDDASRRRFRIYWTVIGPFSALIRRRILTEIKRQAESNPGRP